MPRYHLILLLFTWTFLILDYSAVIVRDSYLFIDAVGFGPHVNLQARMKCPRVTATTNWSGYDICYGHPGTSLQEQG